MVEFFLCRDSPARVIGSAARLSHTPANGKSNTSTSDELENNIGELLAFVDDNIDCFHFDAVCKHVITLLGSQSRTLCIPSRARQGPTESSLQHEGDSEACLQVSNKICQFLKTLSDRGKIDVFRYEHFPGSPSGSATPVQHYRSFKGCTDREWCTIKLLQAACVQVLNLGHPAVVPDLMVLLSSLSTQQLVPDSYWSQAIALCEEGKRWGDLKVLVQVSQSFCA